MCKLREKVQLGCCSPLNDCSTKYELRCYDLGRRRRGTWTTNTTRIIIPALLLFTLNKTFSITTTPCPRSLVPRPYLYIPSGILLRISWKRFIAPRRGRFLSFTCYFTHPPTTTRQCHPVLPDLHSGHQSFVGSTYSLPLVPRIRPLNPPSQAFRGLRRQQGRESSKQHSPSISPLAHMKMNLTFRWNKPNELWAPRVIWDLCPVVTFTVFPVRYRVK